MNFLRNFFKPKGRIETKPWRDNFSDKENKELVNYQKKIEDEIVNLEKEKVGMKIIVEFNERKKEYPENTENAFKNRWELLEEIKAKYEKINQAA